MIAKKKTKQVQQEITENAHQIWLAGLGAVAMAQEEGGKLFSTLVKKGEGYEKAGRDKFGQAIGAVSGVKVVAESYWETFERTLDDKVTSVIHRLGVPTKDEIDTLTERVESLTAAIDKLRVTGKPAPAKSDAPKKAPAKKTSDTTGSAE
jgi:poly(hydroxyalkanoate) granule-associated protein